MVRIIACVMASMALLGCSAAQPGQLNHAFPAPPSVKRMTEAGACQGGAALAAIDLPVPKFPRRAKRQGRQGWVVISLDVTAEGYTSNVFVKRSAPRDIFDKTTIRAVQSWQFQPPGEDGLAGCLVFISYRLGSVHVGK
jgi:TonB family protein